MDINELETYRLSDAVKFHDRLNPALWGPGEIMLPEVRDRLLAIANDFREFLGIDVEVKDITVSGSNAAYTYTPHSDIDLHLVIDLPKADQSEVYRELFDAKKYAYNDQHDFKIGGYDVELYVQNANDVHHSQGIYSLLDNDWVRVPSRRQPSINDISVESKYQDLAQRIDAAIHSQDLDRMDALAAKIRDMRQAGLDKTGEFGAENLAFKVLRNNGTLERLRDARRAAKDQLMSLEERKKKKSKKKVRYAYGGYWFPGYHYYGQTDAATDGGGDGGESVKESTESQSDIITRFARSCADFLGMETMPELKLRRDPEWTRRNGTFGRYTADPVHRIELATNGRHIIDILRTLAHEMTHARQNEVTGLPDHAGETGSEYEDSANAMAGRIMRHWADQEPQMFKGIDLGEDSADHPGDQPAATGDGVLGALRTIQNIGRAAKNLPTQAGAQEELSQELRNWLRRQGGHTDQPTNLPLPDIRQQQENEELSERTARVRYSNEQYDAIAQKYARMYNVPIGLVRHVMQKETGGLPAELRAGARSPKGATGVMQLMPATARELGVDPRDPEQNIKGGVRYLRQQLDAFGGNHKLAMMAYNWGPGNVRRWRSRGSDPRRMPRETRNYIVGYVGSGPRTQVARAPQKPSAASSTKPTPPTEREISAADKQQRDIERMRQQELSRIQKDLERYAPRVTDPTDSENDVTTYPRRTAPQRSTPPHRRKEVWEASGYIPTEKERNDPRFSMALTVDVHPGETGRQANKLELKTDSQGRPALLMKKLNNLLEAVKLDEKCWTGYRQAGMKKKGDRRVPNCVPVEEDQELTEVDMSPGALKRWAQSEAAQRVRVGFEFEMYFPNTSSDDSDDDDPYDYDPDRQANSIQDVIDFFSEGNNPSPRGTLNRLEAQMYDRYSDWRQEMIDGEMTENGFFEFMDEMDETEEIRTDKQAEFRLEAEEELGDEAGRDEISDRAQELWQDWVDTQWNRGDSVYMEQYRDYLSEALDENFSEEAWLQSEYRYMRDVANEWSLDWPHMNERYREGGQDPDAWAQELSQVIGMPVKSGGYHGTRRGEDHANLEYDSSLSDPTDSDDAGLELITPYRPLPEALQILDRVIKFADQNGIYTNQSTGLHMNVSLEGVKNVDWVKLVMFLGDTYILDTFERRANTYARSSMDKLMDKVRERRAEQPVQEQDEDRAIYGGEIDIDRAMRLMRDNMIELARQAVQSGLGRDKYQSVHVKELGDGGSYIEFRGPGGDWLGKQDENADVLRNTVFRLGRAMEIAADPEAERREYAKKLYKTLTPEMPQLRSAMQLFAQYSAGDISREQLKREWAEAVLQAERDKIAKSRNNEGIYKIVDNTTGEVLDRYEAGSDGEALQYAMSRWAGRGINYDIKREVRDTEATPKERRRQDLARRVAGEPTWWRVSVTGRPQYTGWIQAPTRAKAIQDYERRTGIEGTYDRKTFDARVEEPAPLRDPGAAPNTIRGRTFYRTNDLRREANWALVDANGAVRISFPAPDQQAAEDRLRSWQSEQPDEERWLVSLQPKPELGGSPVWRVTWAREGADPMKMDVRADNEQQAIDLVKMNMPSAVQSTDIRAERGGGEPDAQAQPTTATSLNQPGEGESDWEVTWDEYRERDGERIRFSDAVRVVAASAPEAALRLMRSLEAQGRRPFNINAGPMDPPPWRQNIAPAGEPIPGSTLDIQRQRQQATQQSQGEFTGRWLVRSTVTGETVHTISGIGNVQADANRHAARWAQSTGFDDGIEVVPEMG